MSFKDDIGPITAIFVSVILWIVNIIIYRKKYYPWDVCVIRGAFPLFGTLLALAAESRPLHNDEVNRIEILSWIKANRHRFILWATVATVLGVLSITSHNDKYYSFDNAYCPVCGMPATEYAGYGRAGQTTGPPEASIAYCKKHINQSASSITRITDSHGIEDFVECEATPVPGRVARIAFLLITFTIIISINPTNTELFSTQNIMFSAFSVFVAPILVFGVANNYFWVTVTIVDVLLLFFIIFSTRRLLMSLSTER